MKTPHTIKTQGGYALYQNTTVDNSGAYTIEIDLDQNISSGIYYCKYQIGNKLFSKKLILIN